MKLGALLATFLLLFSAVALTAPDCADAARMGGGRSFGSKSFMNRPAQPPAMRQPAQRAPMNQAAAQAAPRPGLFGGMGGLFGGLLAGTLIGSLLSGHGFSGGGFMDIIIIGLLIFLGLKLFARFRNRQAPAPAGAGSSAFGGRPDLTADSDSQPYLRDSRFGGQPGSQASGWDALRGSSGAAAAGAADDAGPDVPAGFAVDEFLRGAKMAYTRLQESWDRRDLDDIAQFATPAVMDELKAQMATDSAPGKTEILLVNAQLLGVEDEGDDQRAQVYFDVLMRERPDQTAPSSAREVWHFLRVGRDGAWKLDGIQQVE